MNADMKWLDNPEVFRVNQLDAHSDHCYYMDYADMEKSENPLMQSLNGQWEFAFSKNVMDRPENFYEENFDASSFDKIMVPGHIELAGIQFWGNSFVAGPQGEMLTEFPNHEEEVRVVEIDKTRSENVRRWWPFFRDRRIDAFDGLSKRFLTE